MTCLNVRGEGTSELGNTHWGCVAEAGHAAIEDWVDVAWSSDGAGI
jgi:hypothetical protein